MPPFDFSTEWLVHLPKMPQWQHFLGLKCHRRLYKVVLGHTQNSDWGLHWWQILQISQLFSKKPRNDDQNLKITADKWKSEISIYQIFIPTHFFICDDDFGQVSSWHSLHQFSSAGGKHWIKLYLIYRTSNNITETVNFESYKLLSLNIGF